MDALGVRNKNYLFITYIVTSKPKRISVAAGLVHIVVSPFLKFVILAYHVLRTLPLASAYFTAVSHESAVMIFMRMHCKMVYVLQIE
jgi:hypothetical protein